MKDAFVRTVRRAADPLPGREGEFAVYWLSTALLMAGWGLTSPLQAIYLAEDAGLGLGAIGAIQALAGAVTFASQAWIGQWADRLGRHRRFLVLSVAASVPFIALFPHVKGAVALAVAVAATGMLSMTHVTLLYTSVSHLALPATSGRTFGAYRTSGSIGWVVTTLSLAWVLGTVGITGAFHLSAALHAVVATLVWLFAPERHGQRAEAAGGMTAPGRTPGAGGFPVHHVGAARRQDGPGFGAGPGQLLRQPGMALFLAGVAMSTLAMVAGGVYFPLFARRDLSAGDAQFGTLMALPAVFEVPFMLWLGRAADRLGEKRLLVAGCASGAVRWTVIPLLPSAAHILPLQPLQSLSFSSSEILSVNFLTKRAGAALRGTAVGLFTSSQGLGRVVAPILGGILGDAAGIRSIFYLSGAAAAIGAGLIALSGSGPSPEPVAGTARQAAAGSDPGRDHALMTASVRPHG